MEKEIVNKIIDTACDILRSHKQSFMCYALSDSYHRHREFNFKDYQDFILMLPGFTRDSYNEFIRINYSELVDKLILDSTKPEWITMKFKNYTEYCIIIHSKIEFLKTLKIWN